MPENPPSPDQIRSRLRSAEADLDQAESTDLASASPAELVVLVDRVSAALADMIRLHRERCH